MAEKIANITISHTCDENPWHLDNDEQVKWIKNILPKEKLGWNWKLMNVKVFDLKGTKSDSTDSFISRVLEKQDNEELAD